MDLFYKPSLNIAHYHKIDFPWFCSVLKFCLKIKILQQRKLSLLYNLQNKKLPVNTHVSFDVFCVLGICAVQKNCSTKLKLCVVSKHCCFIQLFPLASLILYFVPDVCCNNFADLFWKIALFLIGSKKSVGKSKFCHIC